MPLEKRNHNENNNNEVARLAGCAKNVRKKTEYRINSL